MKRVTTAILRYDKNPFADLDSPYYVRLQGQLLYLIKKGNFERREMITFQKKIALLP